MEPEGLGGAPAVMHGGGATTEGRSVPGPAGGGAGGSGGHVDLANPGVQAEIKRQVDAATGLYQTAQKEFETNNEELKPYLKVLKDPAFQEFARIYNDGRSPTVGDPDAAPPSGGQGGQGGRPGPREFYERLNREAVTKGGYEQDQADFLSRSMMENTRQVVDSVVAELDYRFKELDKGNAARHKQFEDYKGRRLIQDLEYENPIVGEKDGVQVRVRDMGDFKPAVEKTLAKYEGMSPMDAYVMEFGRDQLVPHFKARAEETTRAKAAEGLGGRTRIRSEGLKWPELDERGTAGLRLSDFRKAFYTGEGLTPPEGV